jgi:hypothetical protein
VGIVITLLAIFLSVPALGQDSQSRAQANLERFARSLRQIEMQDSLIADPNIPFNQRMLLQFGGLTTFAFLAIDDSGQETHLLRQFTFLGSMHINFDGAHDFSILVRHSQRNFNSGDNFNLTEGDHDTIELVLDRAVYRFDLARYMGAYEGKRIEGNLVIQAGRQLVHWANGVALSQEIDGGLITVSRGDYVLDLLAGISRDSANDFDSSRPNYDNETHRNFFGGKLTFQGQKHKPFIYGFLQQDDNPNDIRNDILTDPPGVNTTFFYESYYIGVGSQGILSDRLVYAVELVYEGGESRSNSFKTNAAQDVQTDDRIEAWALDLQLNYILGGANRTRLSGEVLLASGDEDRGTASNTFSGNTPNTTDNSFNSFGYINTGLAFAPGLGNLMMVRVGATTFPFANTRMFKNMLVGADVFLLNKLDNDAPIDERTRGHTFLGTEADFFVSWQMLSDVTLSTRYGVFFPGPAIIGDSDARHFFYTGVTYAF